MKPSQRLNKDSMDINKYIRIKTIKWDDDSKWCFVNGAVISNTVADKRMKKHLINPRILLMAGSLEIDPQSRTIFADLKSKVES